MDSPYIIPTIPQNLSKEETIVQIVEVLDHLDAITQDIFSQVNKRIQVNCDKVSSISKRIDSAASKVELLKGDKKAKTVFSSSKYPAADINRDYISIFKDISEVKLNRHEVKHTKYSSTYEPLTKLQFYHVKMPVQESTHVSEGLGDVPDDIKWVNDLLLFNSGKNLYTDFTLMDSLKGPEAVGFREYNSASELGAAPYSISQRSSLQQTNKENYFYTPKAEELPALDVPLDLPDLPGIADDLRYEVDLGSSIAPSAMNQNHISNVPLKLPSIMEIKTTSAISPPPPVPPEEIPPEPPVQVEPSLKNESKVRTESYENNDMSAGSVVLPGTIIAVKPPKIEKPPAPPIVTPPPDDSRAGLMDAIRKAGGSQKANLKKTSQSGASATKGSSSGDLMADLHNKLMMRRKGISGAKNGELGGTTVTPDSTLARISSMIPPPTVKSDMESSISTDDEDWNDDE